MRKFISLLVAILLLSAVAIAETDISSMTTDALVELRQNIDAELANRFADDSSVQTVTVDGLVFKLERALIGTDREDSPAIAIVFRVSNTTDGSKSMMDDISYNILQNGANLEATYTFKSEDYSGVSAYDAFFSNIKPGAVDMQLCITGLLNGDGNRIEVDLFNKHASYDEEPYCGTFVVDLSELQ